MSFSELRSRRSLVHGLWTKPLAWRKLIGIRGKSFVTHTFSSDNTTIYHRFKAILSLRPAVHRPANASLPPVPYASITGVYTNSGYGNFELCFVSMRHSTASKTCQLLGISVPTILPGTVKADVPTYLAKWDSPWASHIWLAHFDGNIFNVSMLTSVVNYLYLFIYHSANFCSANWQHF